MKQHVKLSSPYQAMFSLALASVHLLLCLVPVDLWFVVAIPSSFWFFLILPILVVFNVLHGLYELFKRRFFSREKAIYFGITVVSFLIFSWAIHQGCYITV